MKINHFLLLLSLFAVSSWSMEVTFYNIGQGNCTLVTHPGKKTMLVDAGSSKSPLDDPHCTKVMAEIINTIKTKTPQKQLFVVASHADKDHINLLTKICSPLLKDAFSIEFLLGGTPSFYEKADGKELISFLEKNKKRCKAIFASDITGDNRAQQFAKLLPSYSKVLSAITTSENKLDPNDTSIVIKVRDGAFSALLPGDATGKVTAPLIGTKPNLLMSTVYELSHHGAETHNSTTLPLLLAINPSTLILSSGLYEGKFMHPRFETIKTAVEFCVKRNRIGAQPHMLTYQNSKRIPSYRSKTKEARLNVVAVNNDGFCTAQTTFPIYHTADVGTITCCAQEISVETSTNPQEPGLKALQEIQTPRFDGIRFLFFNNMNLKSADLKAHLSVLPRALEYLDLRNNKIGHFGIEHLITLYKQHKTDLMVKLADNWLVDKKAFATICNKKEIKDVTSKNRTLLTFSKKGKAKDTVESLEFKQGHNGEPPIQSAQAIAYVEDSNPEADAACQNKTVDEIYELRSDQNNLTVIDLETNQVEGNYQWPHITDICVLSDETNKIAGVSTAQTSTLFDFVNNDFKNLEGTFKYTNSKKPWKTIGKEFWSLDNPGTNYYHERTPFSKNGKLVLTVSAKNKRINIYKMDQLVFDSRNVVLEKTISEEELQNDLGHKIADIKRVAFTDHDHSVKLNFTDKSHGEFRSILETDEL